MLQLLIIIINLYCFNIKLPLYEAKPPKYAPPVQIKADKMLFEAKIHHKRERSRDRDRRKSDSRKSRRIRRRVQPDSDSSNESLERRNRDNGDKRNRDIKCLDRARIMKDEEVLGHKKEDKNLCGEENFKQIINLQSFDGSFKSIAPFITIPEMPSDLKSLNLPSPLLQHLFFTLLSLTTLSLKFPSTSPQWSLIYTKGLKFLQKHIQSSTLSKILTSTKSLLSQP